MTEITGFTPLYERILLLPDEAEHQTETGIILPLESRKRPNTGKVIEIGHMVGNGKEAPIKVGDHVLYLRYSGFDIVIGGVMYHLIMANDLVGIIDKTVNTFELKEYA